MRLPDGRTTDITASFGVALAPPYGKATDVFDRADRALYRAKTNGRDQVAYQRAGEDMLPRTGTGVQGRFDGLPRNEWSSRSA